ncbi:methyl-accepting chemotaxis protein [Desulfovibrio sp. OttesenSCG-928-C06]|nr:methyl-accepting chemotaxis protein [Desulfovibrio sp. OttesenSCG-928-C06]
MKIFWKLMTLVGGAIVCMVVAFCLVGYFIFTDFGNSTAAKQLDIAAQTMQKEIDDGLILQQTLSNAIAIDDSLSRAVALMDMQELKESADSLMRSPSVDQVTIVDTEGRVLIRGHSDSRGDILSFTRQAVSVPLKDGRAVRGLEPGKLIRLSVVSGTPVKHEGKLVGAVIVGTDLSSGVFVNGLKKVLDVECTVFLDDVRIATTVMRDGKPVIDTRLGNDHIYEQVIRRGEKVVTQNIIAGKTYDTVYWPWHDMSGKRAGMLFVGLDRENIEATQQRIVLYFAGAGLLLAVIILAASSFVSRAIARPLRAATGYAQAVASGDFNQHIESRSRDEVGTLVNALKSMVAQLKERLGFSQGIMHGIVAPFAVVDVDGRLTYLNAQMLRYWGQDGQPEAYYGKTSGDFLFGDGNEKTPLDMVLVDRKPLLGQPLSRANARGEKKYMQVTAAPLWDLDNNLLGACLLFTDETEIREQQAKILALNERITASVKEAHDISGQQAEAFSRLSAQIDQTSGAAQAQDQASSETMDSIAAMSSTLESLARKAEQTTEDTRATKTQAEDGKRVVGETVECINRVAEFAERTEQGMRTLGEQASSITHIVELIKDIADQTNLLALNAAIEAARAGEAGRGFAVVADEVRKLAEKTTSATNDVNNSISALQEEVSQNMKLTGETVELSRRSTELAESSGESLDRIVQIAQHAVGEVLAISQATAEQAQTGSTIAESMAGISSMARQSVQNMQESENFVGELADFSNKLKRIIDSIGQERRMQERCQLDSPYTVQLHGLGKGAMTARVLDISQGGIRVEVAGAEEGVSWVKSDVRFSAPQEPFRAELDGKHGHVVWQFGGLCGIEFDSALGIRFEELSRKADSLHKGW